MKYVGLYINFLKAQQAQPHHVMPVSQKVYALPGLRSFEELKAEETIKFKKEYNDQLHHYQKLVKKHKSARGDTKKDLRCAKASKYDHLESLLQKIGRFTPSERATGFEAINAE